MAGEPAGVLIAGSAGAGGGRDGSHSTPPAVRQRRKRVSAQSWNYSIGSILPTLDCNGLVSCPTSTLRESVITDYTRPNSSLDAMSLGGFNDQVQKVKRDDA